MNDVVKNTKTQERVNSILDFVIGYLDDLSQSESNENLEYLKDDVKIALENYNDSVRKDSEPEEDEETTDD